MARLLKEIEDERVELAGKIRELADRQDSWTAEDRQTWGHRQRTLRRGV